MYEILNSLICINIFHVGYVRASNKVAAAAKDEQRAAAIEAVQVAGEEGRSSLQRGIEEERGARDRLGAELRQSVQAVRDVSERFDAKLGKLQDRVDERLHGATDTCRKLVEKVRLESKASRESSATDLRRALETKLDEATRALSASMDSKFEASAADAQASEAELSGKIDSVVQSAESAAECMDEIGSARRNGVG